MLIYAGKRVDRVRIGRVACFCPICRDMAVHGQVALRRKVHVYGVGLGRGEDVHDEITCEQCGLLRGIAVGEFVGASPHRARHSLEEVVEVSNPTLPEALAERFEIETRLDELTPTERAHLLSEVFTSVNYMFETRSDRTVNDPWMLGLIVLVLSCAIAGAVMLSVNPPLPLGGWVLGLSGVLFVGMVWRAFLVPRRYARRVVAPLLAKGLAPLSPDAEEFEFGLRQVQPKLQKILRGAARG